MKFSIKNFSSKCDQILRNLRIWSHLLEKSLMENLCIVNLCYVMHQNTFRTLTYSELYLFRYTEAFSSILSTIKACSVINEIYSAPRESLSYSQPCLIPSPARWRIGGILKPCGTSPRHIQNSSIVMIVLLFNHIQAYSRLWVILAFTLTWHIGNSGIFRTLL